MFERMKEFEFWYWLVTDILLFCGLLFDERAFAIVTVTFPRKTGPVESSKSGYNQSNNREDFGNEKVKIYRRTDHRSA